MIALVAADPEDPVERAHTVTTHHDGTVERSRWTVEEARYELGDEIARGGGGRVVAARDVRLGREVAVKLPLDAAGSLARLMREAQLMARLEHPSIVSVHDLARDRDGTPFYVMKRLTGETLRARIAGRPFEDRIALLPTLIAIADAVAYAHHRGIVHRDLKPANVIVGEFGETSVIDWGLARVVEGDDEAPAAPAPDGSITGHGAVVGTPAYMSPEQARGEPVDTRTDVYGLGALSYHVLAGEPPYQGASATEVVTQVLEGPPAPLTERQPQVPSDLAAIVAKAMARAPADRYPSAQQLVTDLRAYQAGRLVAAHRYSPWARLRRWSRRHRGALAAAGTVAAAAAAIAIAWPSGVEDPRAMCARAGDRIASLWTPAVRTRVAASVLSSAGPGASTASGAIADRLDAYARSLRDGRIEACAATHVRGEQSADLLDRRMICLDRRTDDLVATIGLFDHVAPGEIAEVVRAVGKLPPLDRCANPVSLAEARALPADPATRASAEVRSKKIAAGRALLNAARYPQALAIAREVAATPGETEATPYAADAHLLLGGVLQEMEKHDEAAPELHRALVLAEIARQDDERAGALYRIARAAVDQRQTVEAGRRTRELGALATRTGDLKRQALRLELESQLAEARGEYQQSFELERQRLELTERTGDWAALYSGWANLAGTLVMIGRHADAEPYVQRALDAYTKTYGRDHPKYARALNTLATIYLNTGRATDAIPLLRQALDVFQRAGLAGTEHAVGFRATLAGALAKAGRHDESEAEYVAVLAAIGDDHPMAGSIMANLGWNRLAARQPERAEPWLRRAVAHTESHLGANHPRTANARYSLALALIERGDPRGALPLLDAALAVQLHEKSSDSDDVASVRAAQARAYLDLGQPVRAVELGNQALGVYAKHDDARERGELRWVVARALHATHGERARVIELAEQAREDLAKAHDATRVTEIDRLLGDLRR